jgi:hypothetical protein
MVSTGDTDFKCVELNYNLTNSENMLGILKQFLYELSEMGKTFLSGEYSGNISEESLNNIIKSAIDKGNRLINEMYAGFVDSLYCLCKLNGIELKREDITIVFNVGRTDDDKAVADVCTTLVQNKILSKATVREKYYGYNKEQSDNEDLQIALESGENLQDVENDDQSDDDLVNLSKNIGNENIGGNTNEAN